MKICEIECENRVFKKMIRKYDNLVDGLRQTVSDISAFDQYYLCTIEYAYLDIFSGVRFIQ